MDHRRVAPWTRCLHAVQTRRGSLGRGLAAFMTLGLAAGSGELSARKKKRKKKCKKPPALSECAELCGVNCNKCLTRADAGPLCGDGITTSCVNCTSSADCAADPLQPFCVTQLEDRESGDVQQLCSETLCPCDPDARGVCVGVFVCGVV